MILRSKSKFGTIFTLCMGLQIAFWQGLLCQKSLYVSPFGDDNYPGTLQKPFATIEKARDVIREIGRNRTEKGETITVFLRAGIYEMKETLVLEAHDSGDSLHPIVYRSFQKEHVRIIGGVRVGGASRVRELATMNRLDQKIRDNVYQIDLKSAGITDYGNLSRRGFGLGNPIAGVELFFNHQPLTLARWPNDVWARIEDVPLTLNGSGFVYRNARLQVWKNAPDLWLHGYWKWDYADSYEKAKFIDTANNTIETYPPHGVYGYTKGKRFYVLNVFDELDTTGEWYLDRQTGIIALCPPSDIHRAEVVVSVLKEPIIHMNNVSNITLQNLDIEYGRGIGLQITGGHSDRIKGCHIRNVGTVGIVVDGGCDHVIMNCEIENTGDEGIRMYGGDRKTLIGSNHSIVNNSIHNFSRWSRTYHPAILLNGVGINVAHNEICHGPHSAIILNGNDHILQYNYIHDVCTETGDAGAVYMGRDLTQQGIVIKYNAIAKVQSELASTGSNDVRGVYLDDFSSGVTVYGNVFYEIRRAVELGGGRDNRIENNIFIKCDPAIWFGLRGWNGTSGWNYGIFEETVMRNLQAVPFQDGHWKEKYPRLANIRSDKYGAPKNNEVVRNIHVNCQLINSLSGPIDSLIVLVENCKMDLVTADSMWFDITMLRSISCKKFDPIPFEQIGRLAE